MDSVIPLWWKVWLFAPMFSFFECDKKYLVHTVGSLKINEWQVLFFLCLKVWRTFNLFIFWETIFWTYTVSTRLWRRINYYYLAQLWAQLRYAVKGFKPGPVKDKRVPNSFYDNKQSTYFLFLTRNLDPCLDSLMHLYPGQDKTFLLSVYKLIGRVVWTLPWFFVHFLFLLNDMII